jgi:hypothetical protein
LYFLQSIANCPSCWSMLKKNGDLTILDA